LPGPLPGIARSAVGQVHAKRGLSGIAGVRNETGGPDAMDGADLVIL
jgi:hypothetical protein